MQIIIAKQHEAWYDMEMWTMQEVNNFTGDLQQLTLLECHKLHVIVDE